ncbi:MAG: beta-propeller domain-containing protein [Polyangiales bacterium]
MNKTALSLLVGAGALALGCQRNHPQPRPRVSTDVPHATPADATANAPDAGDLNAPRDRLVAFGSVDALRTWMRARERPSPRRGSSFGGAGLGSSGTGCSGGGTGEGTIGMAAPTTAAAPLPQAAPAPAPAAARARESAASAPGQGPAARNGDDSITNNQVEGVDVGDIVKTHGEHLVILRRGRLFSVRLGDDGLRPLSMVDAYGRGRAPGGWYDEMLVDGDTIVVIGYSYAAHATEVGLFDIDAEGAIRWRDTLFVRSSDYYSARNYASRLVGHHLVMYTPVPLRMTGDELNLPALRRRPDAEWETVMNYDQLYRPVQPVGWNPVIHTVLSCDLSQRQFACRAVGVVGPDGRNFYVSGSAVYLWVNGQPQRVYGHHRPQQDTTPPPAVLYRLPLDCSGVGAVRARGNPLDQFSFDESGGTLRVLVRAQGAGEGMWGSEVQSGDVGFLRVPVSRFNTEVPTMAASAYRGLPRPEGNAYAMQNRFVGDHLLYGVGGGWRGGGANAGSNQVWVFDIARDRTHRVEISHSVERLEPLGRDALVVGNESGGLTFSAVALDETPTVMGHHTARGASQGETRSHGFFFLPSGDRQGTLGLPITNGNDSGGWQQLRSVSSAVLFLGVNNLQFRELGSLRSGTEPAVDDHCVASCADWYGNARPIFWRGRTFALLGYELVEGTIANNRVRETRRVNFFRALLGSNTDTSGNVFNQIPD